MPEGLKILANYILDCARNALRGSLSSAFNWAGIVGVGAVGAYFEFRGRLMTSPHDWHEVVKWGAIYTAVAWTIIFAFRLIFVAPFKLYYEQRKKADTKTSGNWRAIDAQNEMANALRAHTEELARHRRRSDLPPMLRNILDAKNQRERIAMGIERDPNALKIVRDTKSSDFETAIPRGDSIARTVKISVENTDSNHFVSNCKVHVEVDGVNYALKLDSFTLNPTEKRFMEIATHHENNPADKWIHLCIQLPGGSYIGVMQPRLPLAGGLLTIKATSAETRPAQLICRVFVDDSGRLRMENV
jgi:hypothetical protein